MIRIPRHFRTRFLIPEVIQTSAMDCGPATLKALLEGFRIPVSYGRLREACHTDVDGTSIDTIEDTAVKLGLDAQQIMIPKDHLLLSESQALPAIVVVLQPGGILHFVIVWRNHGRLLQLMDPAVGRTWTTRRQLLDRLFVHTLKVPADDWCEWARSDEFLDPLGIRLEMLGLRANKIVSLLDRTLDSPGWHPVASLDAAVRMVDSLVESGAVSRGKQAACLVDTLFLRCTQENKSDASAVPKVFWSVRSAESEYELYMRGVPLIRAVGHRTMDAFEVCDDGPRREPVEALSPELDAAFKEKPVRPLGKLWEFFKEDGILNPACNPGRARACGRRRRL